MNSRRTALTAFALGLAAVLWTAAGYLSGNPLALAVTLLIGAVYLVGAREMQRFDAQTRGLASALDSIPDDLGHLGDWLQQVPAGLRQCVRRRIEGDTVALPGPALTPYLVGLLVLLGMLGTFLGMVVTLNGAVLALESTTDLNTIRAALAAPVKGLGVAFGTSVAGVATSAMLGLISTLCRRQRQQVGLALDSHIGSALRAFSLPHQRQEMVRALQDQTVLLPALVDRIDTLLTQVGEQNRQLAAALQADQAQFHAEARAAYTDLARTVGQSLQDSVRAGALAAAEAIRPLAVNTLADLGQAAEKVHETLSARSTAQLTALGQLLAEDQAARQAQWTAALNEQRQFGEQQAAQVAAAVDRYGSVFAAHTEALLASLAQRQNDWQASWVAGEAGRQATQQAALQAIADRLEQTWQAQQQQSQATEARLTGTLEAQGEALLAATRRQTEHTLGEVTRLMQTAGEAPRLAAEVIGQLRESLSASMARDNGLLEERSRIMETLSALLDTIRHAAGEQRRAIDELLAGAARSLDDTATRMTARIADDSARLAESGSHLAAGGVELASLGDAFAAAVDRFSQSGDKMMATLQRIEGALAKSLTRSDEQLAYYVAQAREVIDLSILSQQQMVAELHGVAARATLAQEVDA